MATIVKQEDKVFPKEPCDKTLLLNSIKKHQPDGVVLGLEKLTEPRKNNFGKVTINGIFTIIGSMPKCILYELDEEGQYITYEDDLTGETKRKMTISDGNLITVFYPFYANLQGSESEIDGDTTLIITPKTSSYSFFKELLIDAGELPEDMGEETIATCFNELKEAGEGFIFRGKYELIKGKTRSFPSLKVERVGRFIELE